MLLSKKSVAMVLVSAVFASGFVFADDLEDEIESLDQVADSQKVNEGEQVPSPEPEVVESAPVSAPNAAVPNATAPELEPVLRRTPRNYFSLGMGPGISTSNSSTSDFLVYSARLGTAVVEDSTGVLSLGIHYGGMQDDMTLYGVQLSESIQAISMEAVTRRAFGSGLYAGLRLGVALVSAKVSYAGSNITGSGSSFVYGGVVGYEFALTPGFSFTTEVSSASIAGGQLNFQGLATVNYNPMSAFMFQFGLVRHW